MSTADELNKLKELLDNGVLTQEEFDVEKKKILKSDYISQENENLERTDEKERVIATIEPSNKIYLKLLFLLPFLYISVGFWFGITFVNLIFYAFSIYATHYKITNNKIINYFSLITKETKEIEREAIETVNLFQSPIQRLLQIGTIEVTGRGISVFEIKNIDDPESVLKLLKNN